MKKIEFKIIQKCDYSDDIKNILNEEEMESLVQIKYEKVPNLFESLQNDSEKTPVIVVGIDTVNNNIVGVGACSIFKNNIGYLNSFRIKKEYRNKVNFGKAYEILIKEVKNANDMGTIKGKGIPAGTYTICMDGQSGNPVQLTYTLTVK